MWSSFFTSTFSAARSPKPIRGARRRHQKVAGRVVGDPLGVSRRMGGLDATEHTGGWARLPGSSPQPQPGKAAATVRCRDRDRGIDNRVQPEQADGIADDQPAEAVAHKMHSDRSRGGGERVRQPNEARSKARDVPGQRMVRHRVDGAEARAAQGTLHPEPRGRRQAIPVHEHDRSVKDLTSHIGTLAPSAAPDARETAGRVRGNWMTRISRATTAVTFTGFG